MTEKSCKIKIWFNAVTKFPKYLYFRFYWFIWAIIYLIVLNILLLLFIDNTKCDFDHYQEINKNLIRFSSLFNAILIAFISSKIFDVRSEKKERQFKIDNLSNKLTNSRRICQILASNRNFTNDNKYVNIQNKHDELEIWHLSSDSQDEQSQKIQALRDKFHSDEHFNSVESQLYVFYNSFIRYFKKDIIYYEGYKILYDEIDHNIRYPIEFIEKLVDSSAVVNLYTTFENRWPKVMDTVFNFNKLTDAEKKKIKSLASRIDKRTLSNLACDNLLISKMSGEISENVLPELYILMRMNLEGFPPILKNFIYLLLALLVFGVFTPIIIRSYDISLSTLVTITNFMTAHVLVILLIFITQFTYWLKKEINIYE